MGANVLCFAGEKGRPCAACEEGGSKAHLSIPTDRCLFARGFATPRVQHLNPKTYCSCNHCFHANGVRRHKERDAAHSLADALEEMLASGVVVEMDSNVIAAARAALRSAGRLANEVSEPKAPPTPDAE